MFRDVRSAQGTAPLAAALRRPTGKTTAVGLEDDVDQWRATGTAWTAVDERQLTRLLTDSAPISRPPTNSIDNPVARVEHEDTP
jgi:hypothetical protein